MRRLLLPLLLTALPASAADPETPPIGPPEPAVAGLKAEAKPDAGVPAAQAQTPSPAGAKAANTDAAKVAHSGAPDAGSVAAAVAAVVSAKEDDTTPPSMRATALCEELRKAAGARAASKAKLDEERKALAAERAKLEALAADVARAREALKAETERLEALLDSNPSGSAMGRRGPRVSAPAGATAGGQQNIANLAKALKSMKGPQAAALITRMDSRLAAEVLQQMSPRDSGAVLASLKPELAAELMTSLATLPAPEGKEKRK